MSLPRSATICKILFGKAILRLPWTMAPMSKFMLTDRVCLVTGASRGIGRGIALQLGEAGATVYVTGRRPEQSDAEKLHDAPTLEKTAKEVWYTK